MSLPRSYTIYISRGEGSGREYAQLTSLLSQARNFYFTDCAPATAEDPAEVTAALRIASCVLVLWEPSSQRCQLELKTAEELGKSILILRPLGNALLPEEASRYATRVVSWSPESIVSAVRFFGG